MEWVLRLIGTGVDGQSRSFDVIEISRPDGLGEISELGLTLAQPRVIDEVVVARERAVREPVVAHERRHPLHSPTGSVYKVPGFGVDRY